jgi:hypothetical protein
LINKPVPRISIDSGLIFSCEELPIGVSLKLFDVLLIFSSAEPFLCHFNFKLHKTRFQKCYELALATLNLAPAITSVQFNQDVSVIPGLM